MTTMATSKAMTNTQPSSPNPIIQPIIDPMPPSIILIGQPIAPDVPGERSGNR